MQRHLCAEENVMKKIKKISIFVLSTMLLFSLCAVSALAEGASDGLGQIKGEDLSFAQRAEFALQGTASGILMVFAVLTLLTIVVSLSKVIFYDIPRKARAAAKADSEAQKKAEAELEAKTSQNAVAAPTPQAAPQTDDGQLIAVITAAIAATIEGNPEYKSQFASGFRVVSFKRADTER